MKIPQNQNLHSQSFNSKSLEFLWNIPYDDRLHTRFLLRLDTDLSIYMTSEWELTNSNGLLWTNVVVFEKQCKLDDLKQEILNPKNWDVKVIPYGYNYFANGNDLVSLIKDGLEYLK